MLPLRKHVPTGWSKARPAGVALRSLWCLSSSGLGRRPVKPSTRVRIPSYTQEWPGGGMQTHFPQKEAVNSHEGASPSRAT